MAARRARGAPDPPASRRGPSRSPALDSGAQARAGLEAAGLAVTPLAAYQSVPITKLT